MSLKKFKRTNVVSSNDGDDATFSLLVEKCHVKNRKIQGSYSKPVCFGAY